MSKAQKPAMTRTHHILAEGQTGYYEFLPNGESRQSVSSIATGWFARPEHYFEQAAWQADGGQPTIIVDTTAPLRGEDPDDPLAYKLRRLMMAIDDSAIRNHWESAISTGHSFGGGYQAGLIDDAPIPIDQMNFISSVGFGNMDFSMVHTAGSLALFWAREVLPALPSLMYQIKGLGANAPEVRNRLREERVLRGMTGYLLPFIERALANEIECDVYLSPKDHLVNPAETRRIAETLPGVRKIIEIHKHATHLAPNTHGKHVARLLLGQYAEVFEDAA
jgi:hypothetical protein